MLRVACGGTSGFEPARRISFGGPIFGRVFGLHAAQPFVGSNGRWSGRHTLQELFGVGLGGVTDNGGGEHREVAQVLAQVHGGRRMVQS